MTRRYRRSWSALAALAAAATVSTSFATADAGVSQPVTLAHLRLTVTTTSNWTQVQLRPGTIVAQNLVSSSGNGTLAGLGFKQSSGVSTQTVDLLFSVAASVRNLQIEVDKGFLGTTTVAVSNVNSGQATPVASVVDTVRSLTDGSNHVIQSFAASTLMGTSPISQPHADSRRLVLAFYYPWSFGINYNDPRLADRPADPRSVWSPDGVASMTAQAKANGINGFIVSWGGQTTDGAAFDTALKAAEDQHQTITGYLETPRGATGASGGVDPAVVQAHLVELLRRSASPAFLKASDGVPVVFVYSMGSLPAAAWDGILQSVRAAGQNVHLVGDDTSPAYLPDEWGLHRYAVNQPTSTLTAWAQKTALLARSTSILNPAVAPKLLAGTVSPGFDDHALRGTTNPVTPRAGGSTYAATWTAALSGQPDWVLVTSWNEWYEGTQIEPGIKDGSTALSQTASLAASWRAQQSRSSKDS